MSIKTREYSYSVGQGYNQTIVHMEGWTDGVVSTRYGYVSVYAQGDEKHSHITQLQIIREGIVYTRRFNGKRYTKRGIATKAKQFSRDIFEATQ